MCPIVQRVVEVRRDLYGADGAVALAESLGLPPRTWSNYEAGVKMPADTMLRFIDVTDADPRWLLSGEGPVYRSRFAGEDVPVAQQPA